jgi:NDP-sugar pyrophosphorylase family protein
VIAALLLAAGLGTRLDPLTRLVAKPAVPLGRRTLAEHVLAWLHNQAVHDVVVNLHHLPSSLTGVLGDGAHLGLSIRYSWEQTVLGSAGGPRRALALLDSDPFLIVNGDTLCDVEIAPMLDAHRTSGADVTMAVVPNPAPGHYGGVLAEDDHVVRGFIPRGHTEPSWHFVGVQIVNKRTFAGLEDGVPAETVAGIYRDVVQSDPGRVHIWPVTTAFLDIGTPRDYLAAALRQPEVLPAGVVVPESSSLTRCAVWPGVVIEDHVRLEDCIVAGPLHVPCGLETSAAILVPASVARPDDRMRVQGDLAIYPLDIEHART